MGKINFMLSLIKIKNLMIGMFAFLMVISSSVSAAEERNLLKNKVDRFVASHLNKIQEKSFKDGHEYCGLIFYSREAQLKASTAKKGRIDSCLPDDVSEEFEVIASYHTHGSADLDADTEVASFDDLEADIEEGINGYIATPGGRLWLNNIKTKKSILLCGKGCLKADPQFVECMAMIPVNEYTLNTLVLREENENENENENDNGEC